MQTKTCRVCGASYEACRSIKAGSTAFNWREVACSPECGDKYLRMVLASRGERTAKDEKKVEKPVAAVEANADTEKRTAGKNYFAQNAKKAPAAKPFEHTDTVKHIDVSAEPVEENGEENK